MKQPVSTANHTDYDNFAMRPDEDIADLVELSTRLYSSYDGDKDGGGMDYDFGLEKDWSERRVEVCQSCVASQTYVSILIRASCSKFVLPGSGKKNLSFQNRLRIPLKVG